MAVNDTSNDAALARILQERMVQQQGYGGSHGSPPPAPMAAPIQQQPGTNIVYVHESPSTYMASQGSFTSPPVVQQQPQVTHVLRQPNSVPPPQMDSTALPPEMQSQLQSQYSSMASRPRDETTGDAQLAQTLQRMEIEDANRQSQRRSMQRSRQSSQQSYPQVHHHHHQTQQPVAPVVPSPQQQYPGTYPPNQPHPQYQQRREIPYGSMPHRDRVRPAKSDGCGGSCSVM